MKSTWKIINAEERKSKHSIDIQSLMIDNNVIKKQKIITKTPNNSFLSIADSVNSNNNKHVNMTNPINHFPTISYSPLQKLIGIMPLLMKYKKKL